MDDLSAGRSVVYWRAGLLSDVEIEVEPLETDVGTTVKPEGEDKKVQHEPMPHEEDRIVTAPEGIYHVYSC